MSPDRYLSKEKKKELEKELEDLKTVKRREIAEALEFAKSLGDLSENAEYHEALDEQMEMEDRILRLEITLKNAILMEEKVSSDFIVVGSSISIKKDGEPEERKYMIVGSDEANLAENKISNESPLGAALMGKKVGEEAVVTTPKGKTKYTITKIA